MTDGGMVSLGDYVDIVTGYPFPSDGYAVDGVRLLRGDNVGQGRLRWDGAKFWPYQLLVDLEHYSLVDGDVVLAMDRPWISAGLKWAPVRQADLPSLLVQRVARLRARGGLDQSFLRYLVASREFTDYVLAVQTGTAVPHISAQQIRDFECRLPPLSEQREVAALLGALDGKVDANSRLAVLCEETAVRHLGAVRARRRLGELAEMQRNPLKPEDFAGEVVEHFSLPAFDVGRMPERGEGTAIKSNKFRVEGPSVLVSKLNPHIPRVWYAEPTSGQTALASTEFVVLHPTGECTPAILWAACAAPEFASALTERVTGTTGSHQRVRPQDVLEAEVPDVSALTSDVYELVDSLVLRALAARRESEALSRLRDVLLPPLMSGELRVQDAALLIGESV